MKKSLITFVVLLALPAAANAQPFASGTVAADSDRPNLTDQDLATIRQVAQAAKTKGDARIIVTGHADTSGPPAYNMALSLRRANAVRDALVREGVSAIAITVVGKGESEPLVRTGDGVREPQNRRVEIVIQEPAP
jgi:outer membrane protein OmpA-like peptidoglycan-associated protein